jgi:hypothetical protein
MKLCLVIFAFILYGVHAAPNFKEVQLQSLEYQQNEEQIEAFAENIARLNTLFDKMFADAKRVKRGCRKL